MQTFCQKISQTISSGRLFPDSARILVALSGGADSVALLRVLLQLGYECEAVHCNFYLRGAESQRDENFVRTLCKRLGIALKVQDFDTKAYAMKQHISVEMAARELRYDFFEQWRRERELDVIAVAHHRDDNVETVLLNLMRGTGLRGLRGMKYSNGFIVRPFLDVSRQEVLNYLQGIDQDYVTDSTNLETDVRRNRIRLQVLPQMREICPTVDEAVQRMACHLSETERLLDVELRKAFGRVMTESERGYIVINKERLLAEPVPHLVLFELLHDRGFNEAQVDEICQNHSRRVGAIYTSNTHELLVDRQSLVVRPKREVSESLKSIRFRIGDEVDLLTGRIKSEKLDFCEAVTIPKEPEIAMIDARLLPSELELRRVKEGDCFIPFGMKGFKLVSDFLTDLKLNRFEKEEQWVVCAGKDIVWVVARRIDNRFAIRCGQTQEMIRLEWKETQ